jgi:hypothetical protein
MSGGRTGGEVAIRAGRASMRWLATLVVVVVGVVASLAPTASYGYDGLSQRVAASHDVALAANTTTTSPTNTAGGQRTTTGLPRCPPPQSGISMPQREEGACPGRDTDRMRRTANFHATRAGDQSLSRTIPIRS